MEEPLWIDTYQPDIGDLPQQEARHRFSRAVDEPMNLIVHGPAGVGKTAAIRAMAREAHSDVDNDCVEINIDDFFNRSKKEIRNDPRFESFLTGKSSMSKADMVNYALKQATGTAPVSGEYKTIVLDNAEAIRDDFQQALRRIMERHYKNAQFVFSTRQPSKLISPIRSRCFPIAMPSPTVEQTLEILREIAEQEQVEYEEKGLEYAAGYSEGNLREAILSVQTIHAKEGEVTMSTAYNTLGDVDIRGRIKEMLTDAEDGAFEDARDELDDLLFDEGLDGDEVLDEIIQVGQARYNGDELARFYELVGDIDFDLAEGTNDRIHIGHLLSSIEGGP